MVSVYSEIRMQKSDDCSYSANIFIPIKFMSAVNLLYFLGIFQNFNFKNYLNAELHLNLALSFA